MNHLLKQKLSEGLVVFDGAIGTEIYRHNFFINASFEQLCLTAPDVVRSIHRDYLEAGAEVLTTNTYNANARRLAKYGLSEQTKAINRAGVDLAQEIAGTQALVAATVGPIGDPDSPADRRSRTDLLVEQISALQEADFIIFETLRTGVDLSAALEAVKHFPGICYVLSFSIAHHPVGNALASDFEEIFRQLNTYPGESPAALGLNCGDGPESTLGELELLTPLTRLPIIVQPNAGAPRIIDGRTIYMTSAEYFSTYAKRYQMLGAAGIGGCCGIGPGHIAELARSLKPIARAERRKLPEVELKETELLTPIVREKRSALGQKLQSGQFVRSVEITPPRGFDLTATVEGARLCKAAGIDAVNLPDGPRASARISPLATAIAIQQQAQIETILHCCARDRSAIGLQAELLGCAGMNINNLLFITGDPPKLGDYPFSTGVFDLDSIGLVRLQDRMNRGGDLAGKPLNAQTCALIGVGADPNAIDPEREYRRTCEKIEAGADFIITQPVFAVESLLSFLDRIAHYQVPLIAGIWPLTSLRNAEFMRTEVPGVVVPDEVMKRMAAAETREAQREVGIAIARESVAGIRHRVQGVQVSAPFGNVKLALEVLK